MTPDEREAFLARRRGEHAGWPVVVPLAAVTVTSVVLVLIGGPLIGICWLMYWLSGWTGALDVMHWGGRVLEVGGGVLFVYVLVAGYLGSRARCRLPDDAVVRVLEGKPEKPKVFESESKSGIPTMQFELDGIGTMGMRLTDPTEGKLVRTDENRVRAAWSPLRNYYVEWVEVPWHWPEGLEHGEGEYDGFRFDSLLSLEEARELLLRGKEETGVEGNGA